MKKISKYMKNMKSYLLPSVAKMLILPKKDPSLQPLITRARAELDKILKDPVYSSNDFENAQRAINVWFEGYIQRCEKILKDEKVRAEFKEFVLFM